MSLDYNYESVYISNALYTRDIVTKDGEEKKTVRVGSALLAELTVTHLPRHENEQEADEKSTLHHKPLKSSPQRP